MKTVTALTCLLLLASAALGQQAGYVACEPDEALFSQWLRLSSGQFAKPAADAATVSPHAMVTTLTVGGQPIKLAIDSSKPDMTEPDLVRVDATGQGKFGDKPVLPLTVVSRENGQVVRRVGPGLVQIRHGDQTVPLSVSGEYYRAAARRYISLNVCAAVETTVRFAKRDCAVRLIDANGNLKFTDQATTRPPGIAAPGDTVVVQIAPGQSRKYFYGQPVRLDGQWFNLKATDDGSTASAEPVSIPTAAVKIGQGDWRCTLVGKQQVLAVSGGPEPADIPAGEYTLFRYEVFGPAEPDGTKARLVGRGPEKPDGSPRPINFRPDEAVELAIGPPIRARIVPQLDGQQVLLTMEQKDAGGNRILAVTLADGGDAPQPQVEVFDAAGKSVYKTTLAYG